MERAAKERLIGAIVLVSVAWLLIPVFLDQSADGPGDTVEKTLTLPGSDATPDAAQPRRRETLSLKSPEPETPEPTPPTTLPAPNMPAAQAADEEAAPVATSSVASAQGATTDAQPQAATAVPDKADGKTGQEPRDTEQPIKSPPKQEPVVDAGEDAVAAEREASPPAVAPAGQLWAVQLGSFGNEANAQKLAAELRADGLPAFISQVQSGGKTLHRVRIGPQAERSDSEAIVRRLQASGQVARVVAYP